MPNPDSPTGCIIKPKDLEYIISVCNKNSTLVLIDEAYYPFYKHSAINLIKKYNNLIISRTFAKAWGMAGLRIGYGVSNNQICENMHKIRSMYEANTLAINFLNKILDEPNEVEDSIKRLVEGKSWFLKEMKKLGFKVWEANGNFCHIDFGKHKEDIHRSLDKVVLYKKSFDDDCLKNYSRFSSTTKNEFKTIVNVIKKVIVK